MQIGITFEQEDCGVAKISREGLYEVLRCDCDLVGTDLLRCYGIKGDKHICLGVMVPEGGRLGLVKRMSVRQWEPWRDCRLVLSAGPPVLQQPWVPWQGRLYDRDVTVALAQTRGDVTEIALPYSMEEPFGYMELFCMLTPKNIGGKMYLTCLLPNPQ